MVISSKTLILHAVLLLLLSPSSSAEGPSTATLKQIGSPEATWSDKSGITLYKHLQTEFRNLGNATAENISVIAILPGGHSVHLSGPNSLDPNKSAIYRNEGQSLTKSQGAIRVIATCSNCK